MSPLEAVRVARTTIADNVMNNLSPNVDPQLRKDQGEAVTTASITLKARRRSFIKLGVLVALCIIAGLLYQFINIDMKYFDYAMSKRAPKLVAMVITAFCIGGATIVFQSLINNTIVTPCLLGMNALYTVIHTALVFVLGTSSIVILTKTYAFTIDLIVMGIAAVLIYGYLFHKAQGNVLYVLLAGTVMATLFTSVATTLQRAMDPNEYEVLQNSIIAGFSRVNSDIIGFSIIAIIAVIFVMRKELRVLDVITLGKDQAINLGVNYDHVVRKLLIGVAIFIAIATALVGPISFLGLIIANLARELLKTYRHSYLMVGSILIGIVILLAGQALIEHVFHFSTTIAVFINIFGGTYFLYLLMRNRSKS